MFFSRTSSWVPFVVVILCFFLNQVSQATSRKQLHPSTIVVGTIFCDTCFHQRVSKSSRFIAGASVAVECGGEGGLKPSFREEAKTDENGEFRVKLPFFVSKHVNRIKGCSVELIRSNEPNCAVASTATSSSISLKSKKSGTHVYSAGFFTFRPLKQPELCNQKPGILDLVGEGTLPPLPVLPDLPHLPGVPTPSVGTLPAPPITGIPIPLPPITPKSTDPSNEKIFGFPFPPNPLNPPSLLPPLPFQPPPSLLPPLPFQPAPPSLIPPLLPSPPPASLFPPLPFPPIPGGLIPSPPPPPPPAFPIPLPPLPTLPPGFPGIPPAPSSP